jgi:hypothetical protein
MVTISSGIKIGLAIVALIVIVMAIRYIWPTIRNMMKPKYNANKEHEWGKGEHGKTCELLFFGTTWCPYCKQAMPEFEAVKNEYENQKINGYSILFTEIDCTNETPETTSMMNKFNVESYPTIKLIKGNSVIDFDAKPTRETLTTFLNDALGNP